MSAFGIDGFANVAAVHVEIYTSAYHVSGTIQTPFHRVAEILNQIPSAHLAVEHATISEHATDGETRAAASVLVAIDQICVMLAHDLVSEPSSELRIEKRPVRAEIDVPPLRVAGTIHVPIGSRPIDGLLNVPDRFMAMTDATISSASVPRLDRSATVIALRRDQAHLLLVADPEHPGDPLAEVIDEPTAEAWLRAGEPPE